MQFTLAARPPFLFRSVVRSHGWCQLLPFRVDEQTNQLNYTLRLANGQVVDLEISAAPGGIQVQTTQLISSEQAEVTNVLTWMFGLDLDFSAFYAAVQGEASMAHVEKRALGRVLRSPTFFEDVIRTILTTNTLWGATKRMTANLVGQFGEAMPSASGLKSFPTPQRLALATETQLRAETRLGYRAPYIINLAERVVTSELDLESFKTSSLPTLELRKELLKILGVGPYAAANLLMILGRGDFLPIDTWALKMVSQEWHGGQHVTPAQVQAAFEKWGQWKGLVYWFWDWAYLRKASPDEG
jgi:3-methyladenine DNA glycosylase/8-oxoguanine DNA glycosylase